MTGEIKLRRRCKMLVAPGEMKWNPGLKIRDSKKVRPQKQQKAGTLHAPQIGKLQKN